MSKPRFTLGMAKAMGRRPAREPIPFQEILPLKLKDSVSGKGEKTSNVACLQEMSLLFACMSKNDFNQALCSKEISTFNSCFKEYQAMKAQEKLNEDDLLAQGARKLPFRKLNKILERYPQP